MKNVYTILLVFIFSISLLVFPSDSEAQSEITIGGFDISRGVDFSFPQGNVFYEARNSLNENFSGVSYNSFSSLTTETLSGIDILIISSVQQLPGTALAEPLTLDEQTALLEFVQTGGCAILLTDTDGFDLANESLIDAFGMDSSGKFTGVDTAVVDDPYYSYVTNGPFGTIGSFDQNTPGAISNLGPYADPLAQNSIGTALAVIDPGVINEGSGPVIVYSDLGMFRDSERPGGFFPDNESLFLNTINFCRDLDGDRYSVDYGDCDDTDVTVNPGAAEVRYDGIDQDCNGYDLTIDVTVANYNEIESLLTVKAISSSGESANLELVGYDAMIWKANKQEWMFDFVGANPGTVTVSGPEGSWTQSVVVE